MDVRLALLCAAAALLAPAPAAGYPSEEASAESEESTGGGPSKRSPDAAPAPPAAAAATLPEVRFPEDAKQVGEGENARSKKSPAPQELMGDAPHTTTVCIQVRSDRPNVVCGPQVDAGGVKTTAAATAAASARYAYPAPPGYAAASARYAYPAPPGYAAGSGYYGAAVQRPAYGPYGAPQPAYGPPPARPFVLRTPEQPPARESGPLPQLFAAQAPAQPKYAQEAPAPVPMLPKAAPAAGRGPAPLLYYRTAEEETNVNVVKQAEDKYQRPQVIVQKVPVPMPYMAGFYPPALASPMSYRFNCALQPDGSHAVYGLPAGLRGAAAQPLMRSAGSPAAWAGEALIGSLLGRAAPDAQPYAYYEPQGRAAEVPAYGSAYGYASEALAPYDEAAYALAGRSAAVDAQQWEQQQYLRAIGADGAGLQDLSARAVYQQEELQQSKLRLQQMQQQLMEIEQRSAASLDKNKEGKNIEIKDSSADPVTISISQKADPKLVPVKKRRASA